MALMNPVLRRKIQPLPTGTVAAPMSFSGSPTAIKGTAPRTPGMVAPTPVAPQTTPTRVIGFDGPREPPKAPTPMVDPRKPPPPPVAPVGVPAVEDKGVPASTSDDDVDSMIREFLAGQIGRAGKADTAEEEALIRQQMADAAGGMSVNARARAGRSGMASSGALMGQEGDIRRSTSQDALDQILGLRRTEEQRGIENAMGAIGAETGMRSAAANDELRRMALAALQAEMGLDAGEIGGGGAADGLLDAVGAETANPELANAGGATAPSIKNGMDAQNAIPVQGGPPPGATPTATEGIWYHSATRKYYVVT